MRLHKLPDDCHLTYTVSREAWYASTSPRENPSVTVQASSNAGGSAWQFEVSECELAGSTVEVKMFDDAFDAFDQIPAFFAALVERRPTTLAEVRALLDSLGAKDITEREAPSMRGNELLLRSDLRQVALDAYSVVFEPSRKLVRDHQKATEAAVAAALLRLADEHERLTGGDRCCGPAPEPQCSRCGRGDETADWLRQNALRLDPDAHTRAER